MTPLRLIGFSRKDDKEITVLLYDHNESEVVKCMYHFFEPDTLIQCREYNSGILLEELELKDLFNPIK